jgi:protein-L-isoaspartate(D-aspartate) O-methyltransferase
VAGFWSRQVDFGKARKQMVRRDLASRDITNERVLQAMSAVPRERFVWEVDRRDAYADRPLRIGDGQTISQPYMVALMTQQLSLSGGERVLEIGTGSGYQTAVLAELVSQVFTIERIESLSQRARATLEELGYTNVVFRVGDGSMGWPEEEPFDGVIVTAGAPQVPESLKRQLADGGRLVIPVGDRHEQDLLVVTRRGGRFEMATSTACVFVKLIGQEGWPQE